jgi:hypothetical protein
MRLGAVVILMAAVNGPAFGAIDGTVTDRTTSTPASGVGVTMMQPGAQGMQTLATATTDATGHFAFDRDRPPGPLLIQVIYKGIHYNKLLTPNLPVNNIALDVYEPTKSPAIARVAQRMLVFDVNASRIAVQETAIIQNDSKQTYDNDKLGALRFYLPPEAKGQVRVSVQETGGMPLPRAAEQTSEANVYRVNFPIKPGETEIDASYTIPVGAPFTYRGRVVGVAGMPAGPMRLVAPPGVTLAGNDIQKLGTEPTTQATIFNVSGNGNFKVDIAGAGSLHSDDSDSQEDSDAPKITEGRPPIYTHLDLLVGLALAILAGGGVMLFRTSPVDAGQGR